MKSLIISCLITAAIGIPVSSLSATLAEETPPDVSSITPSDSSPVAPNDSAATKNSAPSVINASNISPVIHPDKHITTSSMKTCKLVSDFQATNRYVYQCKSGESYNINAAKLRHCKTGGVAKVDNTVSNNIYSIFCEDGSSTTATCTNGFFDKPHQVMVGGTKQIVITCHDNN
ncbi:MAG: hypothetical protein P1U63_11755 [Coxiellaceae bacterium]|nr:hypothetical protein [Coxiellaceae bacterium]